MPQLAFDKSNVGTSRKFDDDGVLHVVKTNISKATVNKYYGAEIPEFDALGLDPQKIYLMLRDPKELEASAPTFERKPLLSKHIMTTADEPQTEFIVGAIGSDVQFESPYLVADIAFFNKSAINNIESGDTRELSCAYRYDADMTPGIYDGTRYDGVMRNIRCNHVALVKTGRAGRDVVVADSDPFQTGARQKMKMTKLGARAFAAVAALSPKIAADGSSRAVFAGMTDGYGSVSGVRKSVIAMDVDLDPEQLDRVLDAVIGVEEPGENEPQSEAAPEISKDNDKVAALKQLLGDSVQPEILTKIIELFEPATAVDTDEEVGEKVKTAMDAAMKGVHAAQDAAQHVYAAVGQVKGIRDAAGVYKYAMKQIAPHVACDSISDVDALKVMFDLAFAAKRTTPAAAYDSKSVNDAQAVLDGIVGKK